MVYVLPDLKYKYDALEPFIDAKTMEIHHSKHHATYVQKLNLALEGNPELFKFKIEELLADNFNRVPDAIKTAVKNNGGGHANHSFFWECMTADKKRRVFQGKIAEAINKKFGSFEEFKKKFSECALGRFGSGWAWLVVSNKGELEIVSSANQDSPLSSGEKPLLCIDVWEHAYYLRFQNRRNEYIEAFFNVIDWKKVDERFN